MKRNRITTAAAIVATLAVATSAIAGNHGGGGKGGGGGGSRGGHGGSSRGSSHSSSGKSSDGGFNQNSRVVQGGGSFQDKGGRVARAEKIDTKVGSPIVGKPVGDVKKGPIDVVKKPPFGDVVTKPPGKLPPDVKPLPPQPFPPKPFPPKPLPPHNPPHDDHHDHDDQHAHHHHGHHDWPIRIVMPAYPCYPSVVREEVVVVEQVVAPAVPAATDAKAADAKAADAKATDQADAAKAMDNAQATGKLPVVPAGATLTLEGANLGDKQGQVMLQVGKLSLPATVVKWDGKAATTTLPAMGLTESTTAHVLIYTADAKLANSVAIQLVPAANAEDDDKDAPKSPSDAKSDAKSADAKSADAKAGDPKSTETAAGQAQVVSN